MFFNLSQNIWTQSRSLQRYFSRENINSTTGLWFRLIGGRSSESIPKKYLSFGINPIVRTRKTRKPGMVECKGLVDTAMHGNDCQALPLNSASDTHPLFVHIQSFLPRTNLHSPHITIQTSALVQPSAPVRTLPRRSCNKSPPTSSDPLPDRPSLPTRPLSTVWRTTDRRKWNVFTHTHTHTRT